MEKLKNRGVYVQNNLNSLLRQVYIGEVLHSVRRNFLDEMLRSGCEFRKLIPKRSLKRSIETESEQNSVDHFWKGHSLVQW